MSRMAILAVLSLVIAGCGDAQPAGDNDVAGDSLQAPVADPAAAVNDSLTVNASLSEWAVGLSRDSVAAGIVTINIRNAGTMPHGLHVTGPGQDMPIEALAPGGEMSLSLDLTPGEYRLFCPLDSAGVKHETKGMSTRLRVY
jgi:hypothetical protein